MTAPLTDTIREVLEPIAQVRIPQDPDVSLFELGVIDSFGLMNAIARLEEALGVKVPDSDLNPRKFETLTKIERYFASRVGA